MMSYSNYSPRHIEFASTSVPSRFSVIAEDPRMSDLFAIWGKAMTYTYKESGKVKHGL
jgi:hypothetical protein